LLSAQGDCIEDLMAEVHLPVEIAFIAQRYISINLHHHSLLCILSGQAEKIHQKI